MTPEATEYTFRSLWAKISIWREMAVRETRAIGMEAGHKRGEKMRLGKPAAAAAARLPRHFWSNATRSLYAACFYIDLKSLYFGGALFWSFGCA